VHRNVALKVIKLGMDTRQVVARFEAERQVLALMDHPNIAKVFDAGATAAGRPYFVMELVKGERITDYCDKHKLSTRQRLVLFNQVCRAIQHAHQKGIIHRDIKPSNVLVSQHDDRPVPKVIDFGIAKMTAGQQLTDKTLFTAFEQFLGTPAYISPEQAEMSGTDIDTRSDIYSLGVLLYELLTGKTPFDPKELVAAGLDEMRRTIREKEPVRPSTRLHTMIEGELTTVAKRRQTEPPKLIHLLRGDLDWIVMKTLEKDRTRRYETANGLAMDIERHLNLQAVLARPPSTLYRMQRLIRRHQIVFAAAGSVAAAVLAGLGVSTWLLFREIAAHRRAVAAENSERLYRQAAETARLRAEANELKAKEELRKNQYGEDLFRMALKMAKTVSPGGQTSETFDSAMLLHHFADFLLKRHQLAEARPLAEQAKSMFAHHPEWPSSEELHALEVLAGIQRELGDFAGMRALYPDILAASTRFPNQQDTAAYSALRRLSRVYFDACYYAQARTLYFLAAESYRFCVEKDDVSALNGLAWLLATCGDPEVRNGPRAVALAERAVALTGRQASDKLDTLAAAYAEAGRFESAIRAEKEAMDLVPEKQGRESLAIRLKAYESHQAFHE
jgi:tetratricopeptide (TPR) repeat protein